jgi:hypothetical protein
LVASQAIAGADQLHLIRAFAALESCFEREISGSAATSVIARRKFFGIGDGIENFRRKDL